MPKTKISEFSATPANNTDIDSINIAEGCAPSGINDAIRELMAQLKDFQTGAVGDSFNGPVGTSTAAAGAFTTLSASSTATLSGLTASTALALDASKNIVSVTNTGTGNNVLATSPTLVTPILGTPQSGNFSTGTFTWPTFNQNTTGTAAGLSATLATTSGGTGLTSFTSGGVVYASSSSALATGSALTFDGTNLGVGITPTTKLHVSSASNTFATVESTNGAAYWQMIGSNSTNASYNSLISKYGATTDWSISGGNGTTGQMLFNIGGTEGFRLTSTSLYTASGINVGIGTSSPTNKLTIGGTDTSVFFKNAGATTGYAATQIVNTGGSFYMGVTSSTGVFWQNTSGNYAATIGTSNATNLTFATNDNIRATLDSAGNLGLGVTPSAWTSSYGIKGFNISNGAVYGATNDMNVLFNSYFDGTNFIYSTTAVATKYTQGPTGQHQWFNAASGTAGNAISFTQALTLDASGNMLLGTTSGNSRFNLKGPVDTYALATFNQDTATNNAYAQIEFQKVGSVVGSITSLTSGTAYNTTSDYRLKSITGSITTSGAYIDSLNPVEGTWKADGSTFVGLIAHEVQEASRTQVATGTKDGAEMQAMDYSNSELIANLIAEVKSLRQRLSAANL